MHYSLFKLIFGMFKFISLPKVQTGVGDSKKNPIAVSEKRKENKREEKRRKNSLPHFSHLRILPGPLTSKTVFSWFISVQ